MNRANWPRPCKPSCSTTGTRAIRLLELALRTGVAPADLRADRGGAGGRGGCCHRLVRPMEGPREPGRDAAQSPDWSAGQGGPIQESPLLPSQPPSRWPSPPSPSAGARRCHPPDRVASNNLCQGGIGALREFHLRLHPDRRRDPLLRLGHRPWRDPKGKEKRRPRVSDRLRPHSALVKENIPWHCHRLVVATEPRAPCR